VSDSGCLRWTVEALVRKHDRSAFDCGRPALDEFLKRYAWQNQRLGITRTYVGVQPESDRIDGYYSISSGSVEFATLPEALRKRLPRYPIPVALLGRLAVDRPMQGKGLGRVLLLDALERVCRAAEALAIHGVEVVAKDETAAAFYEKHGFVRLCDNRRCLYLPLATIRQLGLLRP